MWPHAGGATTGFSLVHVPELVALALPPSRLFAESIEKVWNRGDAVAPIDHRLPERIRAEVMSVLRPTRLLQLDDQGLTAETSLNDGVPAEDGDALVLATSGTSGRPKGVIHTHRSIEASARATSAALEVDADRDRWLACLPPAHIGGLSVILRALVTGTGLVVHKRFDSKAVTEAAAEGATLTSLVTRTLAQIDPSLFRRILIGGAAPPDEVPDNVWSTYGMTETGSGVVYNTSGGQLVLEGCELRTTAGPEGDELEVRGPMLFRAYRTGSATEANVLPFTPDGWFPTGDLGHIDADGTVVVHGRRGDVIITGGQKVWPGPVERLLNQHPAVLESAVVAKPDPEWGHRVVAVVVPTDANVPPSLDELRSAVKTELPPWCAPKDLVFSATLPKTSIGKVQRAKLAAELSGTEAT